MITSNWQKMIPIFCHPKQSVSFNVWCYSHCVHVHDCKLIPAQIVPWLDRIVERLDRFVDQQIVPLLAPRTNQLRELVSSMYETRLILTATSLAAPQLLIHHACCAWPRFSEKPWACVTAWTDFMIVNWRALCSFWGKNAVWPQSPACI